MATVFENVFKITGAPGNLGAFFMRVFFTGYSRVGAHRIVTLQNKCYWHALVIRFFFGGSLGRRNVRNLEKSLALKSLKS